jgi:sugar O-acyltransferase (sialic acid O-acetyltransferase NeuD family)
MHEILLIGGGGHCKAVIDVIEQENKYKIAGIIDSKEKIGQKVLNYEIIGSDNDLEVLFEKYKYACITIGQVKSVEPRKKLFQKLKEIGFILPSIISPLAYVSKYAFVDEGTTVMHHSMLNAKARVGKNCIINTKALIEHDSIIEDHCHVSTAAVINGGVTVKSGSFIGSNSTSRESIEIEGFIKAGGLVK